VRYVRRRTDGRRTDGRRRRRRRRRLNALPILFGRRHGVRTIPESAETVGAAVQRRGQVSRSVAAVAVPGMRRPAEPRPVPRRLVRTATAVGRQVEHPSDVARAVRLRAVVRVPPVVWKRATTRLNAFVFYFPVPFPPAVSPQLSHGRPGYDAKQLAK